MYNAVEVCKHSNHPVTTYCLKGFINVDQSPYDVTLHLILVHSSDRTRSHHQPFGCGRVLWAYRDFDSQGYS